MKLSSKILYSLAVCGLVIGNNAVQSQPVDALTAKCRTIVHRAYLSGYDEEQWAGIKDSPKYGYGAELDARVTTDGAVVMVHDDTLTRISGGTETRGAEQMTLAEVRAVTLVKGGRVMTFGEAVNTAQRNGAKLLVEIKDYGDWRARWDSWGFAAMADAITSTGMQMNVRVGGWGYKEFQTSYPDLRTYYRTVESDPSTAPELLARADTDFIMIDPTHYDSNLISNMRDLGGQVVSKQVNTREELVAGYNVGLRTFQANNGNRASNNWCPN